MTRLIAFFVMTTAALGISRMPVQLPPRGPFQFLAGTWVVNGHFETGGPAAISERELNALRGTKVKYGMDEIRFGSKILKRPHYTAEAYSKDRFFRETHVYCRELGICGEPIIVIDAVPPGGVGSDFPGVTVVWIDQNHLAALDAGVYLSLVRIGAKRSHE